MTPADFKQARLSLGLSVTQTADLLGVDDRTVGRWEADPALPSSRSPHPTASRVMGWMLDGFRPPEWPE